MPSKNVYSCSMPNHVSCSAYFSATSRSRARVLLGCGLPSTINTSHKTSLCGSNARKARKVYTFSKELCFHVAVTWLVVVFYNFTWKPQSLRERTQARPPRYHYRTPAMAAGLATEPWSLQQVLTYPIYRPQTLWKSRKRRRRKKKKPEAR